MAHFHRPNIVIFDETEVNYNNAPGQGLIVLVMPQSPHAHIDISHVQIQSALKQQTGVYVPPRNILRYLSDYVVATGSFEKANKILVNVALQIGEHHLAILPLTPGYGSIEVSIDARIPNSALQPTVPQDTGNYQPSEPLKLIVTGVPLVFWCQHDLLPRIFRNICHVCDVRFIPTDHAFSMLTYASRSTIPMMAQIGAVTGGGFVLNIWPIWINVNPAEPGDIQTLQANERPNQRLRYTIYPQQNGDEGAGPSGEGGALGAGHQQPAPVDSSSDGLNQTLEDLGTGSTEVPETASPEITSSHLNIEG
ncbi:unnamed protein product [Urochloa decumbens]|uniref:Uncharacterized protein n=1 Tax=Urochloa decumbens TaxID=240449 RepID=A0ABC9B4Q8_9POAL